MSAASKARREGSHRAGAALRAAPRVGDLRARPGVSRAGADPRLGSADEPLQGRHAQHHGPVDRRGVVRCGSRAIAGARACACSRCATAAITMLTPLVRAIAVAGAAPGSARGLSSAGRTLCGVSAVPVGRLSLRRRRWSAIWSMPSAVARDASVLLQCGLAVVGGAGVVARVARRRFNRRCFRTASFWHDSPTFFFIRLGLVALTRPGRVGRRAIAAARSRCSRW